MSDTPTIDAEASDGWSGDAVCVSAERAREFERALRRMVELWDGRELSQYEPFKSAIREAKEVLKVP